MEELTRKPDYSGIISALKSVFENVIDEELILNIVEDCGGDMNRAAETIMNITMENNTNYQVTSTQNDVGIQETEIPENVLIEIPSAEVNYNSGAIPKSISKPENKGTPLIQTDQIHSIIEHHNNGYRIAIIMRGVPGSGKSFLAKQIIQRTIGSTFIDYKTHIFSADDYFLRGSFYKFDKHRLHEAHDWNQKRFSLAVQQGISPVVVDNTNINVWEMNYYTYEAVKNGYLIKILSPNTPWEKNARELVKRNIHNVPIETIKRMLDNYEMENINSLELINYFGLSYPINMVPPVLRNIPAPKILKVNPDQRQDTQILKNVCTSINVQQHINESEPQSRCYNYDENVGTTNSDAPTVEVGSKESKQNPSCDNPGEENTSDGKVEDKKHKDIEQFLQEIEEVEKQWERGEKWEAEGEIASSIDDKKSIENLPKPQRSDLGATSLMDTVNKCQDWTKISSFMPWQNKASAPDVRSDNVTIETASSSTCIDPWDIVDPPSLYKVLIASPRDINRLHLPKPEKIPDKRKLDKSTMINECSIFARSPKCDNEEKHFNSVRQLFKAIPKPILRDIFDRCGGHTDWIYEAVVNGIMKNEFTVLTPEDMSVKEEVGETCNCFGAFDTIPDIMSQCYKPNVSKHESPHKLKKIKKDNTTEKSLELKKIIEESVVISDDHYSAHCLNIRKMRRGEYVDSGSENEQPTTSTTTSDDVVTTLNKNDFNHQSPNNAFVLPSTSKQEINHSINSKQDISTNPEEVNQFVNLNLGREFVSKLDAMFGRQEIIYPDNIETKVSLPMSLLTEINALWIESLTDQYERLSKQSQIEKSALMIKQDEEFARQLASKEAELAKEGKEPEVPDFREIMDMDLALTLYHKDVACWRNNEPNDLAAKMSRDKLYNIFPELSPDILSEVLMAYDNNFQTTVEVLLMSTGRAQILEEDNGFNKFVLKKEIEHNEKILKEKFKELNEEEWPLLPKGEKVEMTAVESYRQEAEQYLLRRQKNYHQAQDYMRRGMTQVANYYSELTNYYRQKYEQASSLAAISLVQVHASSREDNTTIDLHFLRVAEAKESLDLFIDSHIQRLRDYYYKGGPASITLFIITGRGLHSQGGPRIKPAIKKRLLDRRITHEQKNPGLLSINLNKNDKLTTEIVQSP